MAEVISGATAKEKSALELSAAITVGYVVARIESSAPLVV